MSVPLIANSITSASGEGAPKEAVVTRFLPSDSKGFQNSESTRRPTNSRRVKIASDPGIDSGRLASSVSIEIDSSQTIAISGWRSDS